MATMGMFFNIFANHYRNEDWEINKENIKKKLIHISCTYFCDRASKWFPKYTYTSILLETWVAIIESSGKIRSCKQRRYLEKVYHEYMLPIRNRIFFKKVKDIDIFYSFEIW